MIGRQGWRGPLNNISKTDVVNWDNYKSVNSINKNILIAIIKEVAETEIILDLSNGDEGVLDLQGSSWILKNKNNSESISASDFTNFINEGDVIYVSEKLISDTYVKNSFKIYQKPEVNGALVAVDPNTGKVLALVGGRNFKESKFNRATQAKRQAGSTI